MSAVMKLPENSAESLLLAAVEKGADVDTMERLLAMRREIRAEEARDAYYSALTAFQSACPDIPKTKEVKKANGDLLYRYAPLDTIIKYVRPALEANGFSFTFNTELMTDGVTVTCTAHHKMGHSESSSIFIPAHSGHNTNDAQQTGSANTYGKRYTFCNVFAIVAEEDDDGKASGIPQAEILMRHNEAVRFWLASIMAIKDGLAEDGDMTAAAEAYAEMPKDALMALNVAPTKGGIWTTEERKRFKEDKDFQTAVHALRKDAGWYDQPENQN